MTAPALVFGDDGSECSDSAWSWITAHSWPGWRISVLTANPDESLVEWGAPASLRPWEPPWPRDTAGLGGSEVEFLTAATDPRAMLADVSADLIVVGDRGRGHVGAVMAGSTTEWLLHHPPAPLAVVRRRRAVSTVLICADGSAHADRAVAAFAALPWSEGSDVAILAVDDGRADPTGALASAHAALGPRGAEDLVRSGRPSATILGVVEEREPDLVVLGTRGLTGWRRLRLGSTAATVARSVRCDSLLACVEGSPS